MFHMFSSWFHVSMLTDPQTTIHELYNDLKVSDRRIYVCIPFSTNLHLCPLCQMSLCYCHSGCAECDGCCAKRVHAHREA